MFDILFNTVVLAATVRLAAPLVLASMGGIFGDRANILNISLESLMLTGAFFATWGSYLFENAWMGLLYGMIAGVMMSCVFGVFVLHFDANPVVVGVAMNLGAWGFTSLLLESIFGTRGYFRDPAIKSFTAIDLPILGDIPVVCEVLNNQNILVYLSFLAVLGSYVILFKTPFGLRLRGVGINEKAAQTTGTSLLKYRWISLLFTGVLTGMSGAMLPLSGISMFTEEMSAGKGFLAVAAIMIGKGNPVKVFAACLIFAYADAVAINMQSFQISSQLVLMLPYVATIVVLMVTNLKNTTAQNNI